MTSQFAINGFCKDKYLPFRDIFEQNFVEGLEIGASLCLTLEGEPIVDIWGGHADLDRTRPWQTDTIACVFSSSKIPTIISVLLLIDRGLIALDEPVARYWPEFGQNGKDMITVRQAMTHRARVPGISGSRPLDSDWQQIVDAIAAEAPWFEEDTLCYHPITFGFILGELVQRVSGKPFRQFLIDELIAPMDIDFHMGLDDKNDRERVAQIRFARELPTVPGTLQHRVFSSFSEPEVEGGFWLSWSMQSSVNPGVTGHTNARGMCALATMLANNGEFNGHNFLSPDIIGQASTEQVHDTDPMLGELRLGLGFGLDGSSFRAPTPQSFHWGGLGGSWCFMDPSRKLAGAYVMNNCHVPGEWGSIMEPRMERFFDQITQTFV